MNLDYLISYIVWFLLFETFFLLVRGFTLLWDNILLPILSFVIFLIMTGVTWGVIFFIAYDSVFYDLGLNDNERLVFLYFSICLAIIITISLYYVLFGEGEKPDRNNEQSAWYIFWNEHYEEPIHKWFQINDGQKLVRRRGSSLFTAFICIPLTLIFPIWATYGDLVSEILSIVYEAWLYLERLFHNETSHNRLQSLL